MKEGIDTDIAFPEPASSTVRIAKPLMMMRAAEEFEKTQACHGEPSRREDPGFSC